MDTTVVGVAAIIGIVVVIALLLFRTVNFEAAWKDRGLKLGASNQEPGRQRDIAIKELQATTGAVDATTPEGSITGDRWTAGTDVRLAAGTPPGTGPADPKERHPQG